MLELRRNFWEGDNGLAKAVELKKIEKEGKFIKKSVQEFRRAARRSEHEKRPLVEEV